MKCWQVSVSCDRFCTFGEWCVRMLSSHCPAEGPVKYHWWTNVLWSSRPSRTVHWNSQTLPVPPPPARSTLSSSHCLVAMLQPYRIMYRSEQSCGCCERGITRHSHQLLPKASSQLWWSGSTDVWHLSAALSSAFSLRVGPLRNIWPKHYVYVACLDSLDVT